MPNYPTDAEAGDHYGAALWRSPSRSDGPIIPPPWKSYFEHADSWEDNALIGPLQTPRTANAGT